MSAERLREAAALMRTRANSFQQEPEFADRWTARPTIDPDNHGWVVAHDWEADFDSTVAQTPYDYTGTIAQHIASWHPAVALAVADWLDATAERHAPVDNAWNVGQPCCQTCGLDLEGDEVGHCEDFAAALAVADAYLGAAE